jgi:hypothetical protein
MIRIRFVLTSLCAGGAFAFAQAAPASPVIVCPAGAPANVRLAAKEIRRYVYLRTGELLPVTDGRSSQTDLSIVLAVDPALEAQQYRLQTKGSRLTLSAGSDIAVLYGAYALAEKLGVRFYLHGDVVPDGRIPLRLPQLEETRKPLFALRGVNPWGSHPFGFDAWSADDYKAIFTQLAKMRMNFLGIHCYPEARPYAEPTVWHGLAGDFNPAGEVNRSYVSHYYNTLVKGFWGPILPKPTSDYSFGGALLFARDDWAPPVMAGFCPLPDVPADCNEVFNRMAAQFREAFAFARRLSVKTCLGTEAPLLLPQAVRERAQAQGKNPSDPAVVREVYESTFRRIMASHPLDYYWIWTPEDWTWENNQPAQYSNTVADIKIAIQALKTVGAPFQLATCGWVLGPAHDRAAFDHDLPKNIPMGGISREFGYTEVDPAFGRIAGRERWAIPWLESDSHLGLAALQLEAGRMRRDAADALAYGCTGLMGLHWRTEILSPNISALAQAAWDQSWNTNAPAPQPRTLRCDDFYADWARANFGMPEVGQVFAALDGKVPPSVESGCPAGRLTPLATPWSALAPQFGFVEQLEKLRPRVHGAGNLDRFDYWLNTCRYHRSLAQLRCALAKPNTDELTRLYGDTYRYLLATVNTPGALAMVVNLENNPAWSASVGRHASQPWPKEYRGEPRLIVPTVRSVVVRGESLTLNIIALDQGSPRSVSVLVRPLGGKGAWTAVSTTHVARAVYEARLPAATDDFEYHVVAISSHGHRFEWPATAPEMSQTVVVTE